MLDPVMLDPVRITAPASPLVTVAEARRDLKVDLPDDDGLIEDLIATAESLLDGYSGELGRALVTQVWRQDLPCFPASGVIHLPLAPVRVVSSITYWGLDGVARPLSAQVYSGVLKAASDPYIKLAYGQSWPATYPRDDAVSVTFEAGYGAPGDVPAAIRRAALLIVGHLYENREAVTVGGPAYELPFGANRLTSNFRRVRV